MIYETMEDGSIKKLARRKLDYIDSNIASYLRILNGEEQLENSAKVKPWMKLYLY